MAYRLFQDPKTAQRVSGIQQAVRSYELSHTTKVGFLFRQLGLCLINNMLFIPAVLMIHTIGLISYSGSEKVNHLDLNMNADYG
jgi:hypothetical protein